MLEFVKQSKKRKLYCILGILYLLCIIFVANDAWLYSTPIAKLTKVEISVSGEETGTRGAKEKNISRISRSNPKWRKQGEDNKFYE